MDRVMLDTLVEEAQLGNKPFNTFKNSSFVQVAQLVKEKFGVQCVLKHVENHLRTIKGTWNTITKLHNKSGFGWDDNLRMITCSKESYDEEVTAHPTHEKFLNKKIEMYDEMSIVVGKDMTTGCFAKSFVDIDMEASTEVNSVADIESNEFEEVTKSKEASSAPSSKSRFHRKRCRDDGDSIYDNKVDEQLGEVALAIKKLFDEQVNTKDLYKEVMKIEGFDEVFLGSVFDHLFINKEARGFMVKSVNLQRKLIEKFMTQEWRGY